MLCGGCVAEPVEVNVPQLEQAGMRVEFMESFPFTKGDATMETSAIEDVNLYIFDSGGVPVYSKFFPDGNIGVLFEPDLECQNIWFTKFSLDWIKGK